MKTTNFIILILQKYPRKLVLTILLLLLLNTLEACAIFSVAPLVDFITKPNLSGASEITIKVIKFLNYVRIPVTLINIAALMFCFTFLRSIVQILVYSSILKIKFALIKDLMLSSYKGYFKAGWPFFSLHKQGILGNTIVKEIISVGDCVSHIGMIFVRIIQVIVYFTMAFLVSWKITLCIAVPSLLIAVPFSFLGRLAYKYGKIYIEISNSIYQQILENFSAAKLILGYGLEEKGTRLLNTSINTYSSVQFKTQILQSGTPMLFQPVGLLLILFSVILSQTVIIIPLSSLSVILFALYLAIPQFGVIIGLKNLLLSLFPSYEQILMLDVNAREFQMSDGVESFISLKDKIEFKNVSFIYPERNDKVICNVNITIPRGKMIAFIGKSGAGKSTLIDLILRFYDPKEGRIEIDGINIKDYSIHSFREKIGYVPQDGILFNMSIRNNIAWSMDSATEDDIHNAIRIAYVDEFLKDTPSGVDTLIGDRGVWLSGGQRQRIALARAIVRKPELLILDEATSSLDSISEKLINEAVEQISKETTVIIVAHRLSTIVNADYIYVIDDGRIVEEGVFSELCQKKGICYELAKVQGMV